MASKIKIPKLESSSFKGWAFVLVAGSILTVLALIDAGQFGTGATGSTGCVMIVTADQVNVRPNPGTELAPVATLNKGKEVDAQRVVTNGFRQLAGENRWALDSSLAPKAGSSC
ncbi:SH3 domain-containing protein [Pseudonocardia benzenivorans]|jgi:hypothetical protein|uniref:SH3b domain-containing protein n=2 Tax=Pseudonocardia TaxID=1847 RepID=F4CUX6_PSEUX|nr:hypothetical protein [Pseudonocardia dioxanivorans]AEA27445.1 hypothetical protein Psed_5311 [Pseudonocardia dioxanivorans CB1190]GJF06940.1 hypothetical protein PSD17_58870 [Pseudonocardia sp. D17]